MSLSLVLVLLLFVFLYGIIQENLALSLAYAFFTILGTLTLIVHALASLPLASGSTFMQVIASVLVSILAMMVVLDMGQRQAGNYRATPALVWTAHNIHNKSSYTILKWTYIWSFAEFIANPTMWHLLSLFWTCLLLWIGIRLRPLKSPFSNCKQRQQSSALSRHLSVMRQQ